MGNCIRKRSASEWGGEDWGSFGSGDNRRVGEPAREYGQEMSEGIIKSKSGALSSSPSSSPSVIEGTEVKIKVSKKQLEQLLKTAEFEGLSAQEVLARLMNDGDDQFGAHRRPGKHAPLQSIPE